MRGKGLDRDAIDNQRRKAVKRMGRYAMYTAPSLIALLMTNPAKAAPNCSIAGPAGREDKPDACV